MRRIESSIQDIDKSFKNPSVLGVFVNNHDNARFLHYSQNKKNFQNAIAFSLLTSKLIINKMEYQ